MATDLERLVIALTERQNNFIAQLQTQQSEALAAMMTRVESRPPEARSLVDSRGIGKPDTLTSKTAHNPTEYKVWRVKYVNWVTASMPEMLDMFALLERNNEDIITDEKYREFLQSTPAVANFSAQLRATLVSLCVAEPLNVVLNTPVSPQAGLESMRRLNQRYDPVGPLSSKLILQKLMSTKPVGSTELRSSLEQIEKAFLEYEQRSGNALPEDMQLVVVEQLLSDPIKTHVALNSDRLGTLAALRVEILKYADRISQERTISGGASPMEVDVLTWQKGKSKGRGKGKGKYDYAQPKGKGKKGDEGKGKKAERFEGTCYNCGKQGHRSSECWSTKTSSSTTPVAPKGKGKGKDKRERKEGHSPLPRRTGGRVTR